MAFEIRKVGSTLKKTFDIRDVLRLLGDRINDEVRIDDVAFRISSATELDGGDGGSGGGVIDPSSIPLPLVDWIRVQLQVTESGQTYFPVTVPYGDPEGYFLVVNGAMYDHGINSAFHITEATLVWHGGFTLEVGDRVYLKYLTLKKNNA
ncbi:MAG: hypothetical protein ACK5Q2_09675 [Bacteroidota bacterium]|jgi:hypothetical protein